MRFPIFFLRLQRETEKPYGRQQPVLTGLEYSCPANIVKRQAPWYYFCGGFAQALNLRENGPQTCGEKKGEYADENNGVCDQS